MEDGTLRDPRRTKSKDRALSPATKNNEASCSTASTTDESSAGQDAVKNFDAVETRTPDVVKTVRTIEELNDALQRHLLLNPMSEAVLNFKGAETMEEIIAALFVLRQQDTLNGVEKELQYDKLMADLNKAGYNQENTPPSRNTASFSSTEDLINCLVDDSITPTTTDASMQNSISGLKVKDNQDAIQKLPLSTSAGTPPEDKPNSSFSLNELLERTGGDIMVDPKTSFEDIQLEDPEITMDLDAVEGSDLLLPCTTPTVTKQKKGSRKSEDTKEVEDDSDDSFHSAHTTISSSPPTNFLPKDKNNKRIHSSSSFHPTNDGSEDVVDVVDVGGSNEKKDEEVQKETNPVKTITDAVINSNDPGLSEDELELIKRFGLSRCSIRLKRVDEDKKEELVKPDDPIGPSHSSVRLNKNKKEELVKPEEVCQAEVVDPIPLNPAGLRRGRTDSKGSSTVSTRRKSPRKTVPSWKKSQSIASSSVEKTKTSPDHEESTPLSTTDKPSVEPVHKNVVGNQPQASTGKTRIKARKPTDEELRLAEASSLTPEQVILQRLSSQSYSSSSKNDQFPKAPFRTMFKASRAQACPSLLQQIKPTTNADVIVNIHASNSHPPTSAVPAEVDPVESQGNNGTTDTAIEVLDVDDCPAYITKENALTATSTVVTPTPPTPPPTTIVVTPEEPLASESGTESSRPVDVSIEQELDDLLGVIPTFDIDDDEPMPSFPLHLPMAIPDFFGLGDNVDVIGEEFADVLNHEPEQQPTLHKETHESGTEEEPHKEKQSSGLVNTEPASSPPPATATIAHSSKSMSQLPEEGSSTKSKPKAKPSLGSIEQSNPRPGPKSKTRKADESDINPETTSVPNPVTKRRKISPSSSSSSSDAYVPLVNPKVPLEDVDEESSDGSSSSEGDSYSPDEELEDVDDLLAILPPKPSEKLSVIAMQEEWELENPKESRLKELMNKTSSYRRRFLEADNYDIDHGMKVFPALRNYKILKAEYDELNPEVSGRMARLEKELKNSLNNATTVKKRPGQKRHVLWERALLKAKNWNSLSKGMKRVLGMICLCFHLAENHAAMNLLLIRKRGEPLEWQSISTPRIVMYEDEAESEEANSMYVYAEGLRHVKVPNVYEGVLTIYSLHYVFSVEYLSSLRGLFKHLDTLANIKT